MTKPRRRQAGEGGISEYPTKSGVRYLIKYGYTREDGSRGTVLKRGFPTRKAAAEELRARLTSVDRGSHVAPNRVTVDEHFTVWLAGLRKQPSTVASYSKNVRLHVVPYLGALRLDQLTGSRLTRLYRQLESEGRADGSGGLSPRTVRYIHTIVHSGLSAAVRDGLVAQNAADKADPPSAKAAASPEMQFWTAPELRAFLEHRRRVNDELLPAWHLISYTGMRRGEALALRWGDVDLDAARLSVRRGVTVVKNKGQGQQVLVGITKTPHSRRTVDLDANTVAMLRAYKAARGLISLSLARDDALILGDVDGRVRHPERFSRRWDTAVRQAMGASSDIELPKIRLHDLRHTHATLLLASNVPVKVVSERLGHANATITLGTYAHVMPGMQAEAAAKFGALMTEGAS
ncbi:site-specific integrase [Terrabacter terrae]|uniref:Site-specific integrase n=1 Tax=Terrabacter terrae TaxID=318434 RepID=A0ABP5G5L8_9MICO